jgi:hypothetical protein
MIVFNMGTLLQGSTCSTNGYSDKSIHREIRELIVSHIFCDPGQIVIEQRMTTMRHELWAVREFGRARLGDERRRERLIRLGAALARTPAGRVTELFAKGAEREAAYRLLENDAVDGGEIARAAWHATANRCFDQRHVFVPVDGTSLNLTDRVDRRGLGSLQRNRRARGLQVMTAIAVRRDGTPLGVCGQAYWARRAWGGLARGDYDRRDIAEKETQRWLDVMEQARSAFRAEAAKTRPWFQLDRGGDAWPILTKAISDGDLLTVRATHNRRVAARIAGRRQYLWDQVRRCEPMGSYALAIPVGENRTARTACMQIQCSPVQIEVRDRRTTNYKTLALWAVRVIEVGTKPPGEAPTEWLLLTTFAVETLHDAMLVVDGYAARWRIEDFHKTWKTGACEIENTQLQARDHIERFAVISASVAMRIQRLTHLARTTPDEPATIEFTRPEIDAAILLREPKGVQRGDTPTVGEVVRWVADIGGFMGPSPKNKTATRRPGAIVIRRGLEKIEPVASLLARGVEM